jgi:hypothetical protein
MTVGSEKTSVTVEAIAPQLSTQDATVGAVIDNNFITQFPLLLRGWDDLTILVAGVQGLRQTDQAGAANSSRAGQFNVHGVRSLQNNFLLDGLDNNSISENVQELSTQVVRPSVDAIQECHYQGRHQQVSRRDLRVLAKPGFRCHGFLHESQRPDQASEYPESVWRKHRRTRHQEQVVFL